MKGQCRVEKQNDSVETPGFVCLCQCKATKRSIPFPSTDCLDHAAISCMLCPVWKGVCGCVGVQEEGKQQQSRIEANQLMEGMLNWTQRNNDVRYRLVGQVVVPCVCFFLGSVVFAFKMQGRCAVCVMVDGLNGRKKKEERLGRVVLNPVWVFMFFFCRSAFLMDFFFFGRLSGSDQRDEQAHSFFCATGQRGEMCV